MDNLYLEILKEIGENPEREGLAKTPSRAAKAFEYLTSGYRENIGKILNNAVFSSKNDDMVIVKEIEFYSLCEHHLLPFFGTCHVAYIPKGKIIGLSKIPRIVDVFSKRLQVQENLTREIAECILEVTGASGAAVVVEAKHMCMMMRGIQKQNPSMKTSAMLGKFRECPLARNEFLNLIR